MRLLTQTKQQMQDNKAKDAHESKMIYMQDGWSRVKQTEGPKHTNTSGDYSTGAIVLLYQMLPRGQTTGTQTHTQRHA